MKQRPRIYYTENQKTIMWERWRKGESLQHIAHPSSYRQMVRATSPRSLMSPQQGHFRMFSSSRIMEGGWPSTRSRLAMNEYLPWSVSPRSTSSSASASTTLLSERNAFIKRLCLAARPVLS